MRKQIKFKINPQKTISSIEYVVRCSKHLSVDIDQISQILFHANKDHINKYYRPIIGDRYVSSEVGPIPKFATQLMKNEKMKLTQNNHCIEVNPPWKNIKGYLLLNNSSKLNMDIFSESDIECLNKAIKKVTKPSIWSKLISFNKPEFYKIKRKKQIPYELFIKDHKIISYLEENSENMVF